MQRLNEAERGDRISDAQLHAINSWFESGCLGIISDYYHVDKPRGIKRKRDASPVQEDMGIIKNEREEPLERDQNINPVQEDLRIVKEGNEDPLEKDIRVRDY
ncbi:hypothetical protein DID88_005589 [Monilinia fructigena]|uniref:Uncharacterized protein n=1 Tax=Monilinia fructigena TaxID=38457 RepID=A0A395J079_9HELO|nr:hypothetical protein DID88_005589 [Monilinia fructigena]